MDLIDAMEQLDLPDSARAHLLMVGSGPLEAELKMRAAAHGSRISFTGFLNQSEISAAFAVSDCLVLSSVSETWGLVVNEAMACGLPAIVSDACGCAPDLIEQGRTGYSYPQGNVPELTKAMARMMDSAAAAEMGQEAKRRLDRSFTVSQAANVLTAVIPGAVQ